MTFWDAPKRKRPAAMITAGLCFNLTGSLFTQGVHVIGLSLYDEDDLIGGE